MSTRWAKLLLIATCVAILPALSPATSSANSLPAFGTVIYSDMGNPGSYSYLGCCGWTIVGSTLDIGETLDDASAFTSSGNFSVSEIDVGIGYITGDNEANFSIWTDVANLPGTQIGNAFQVANLPTYGSTSSQVVSVTGITGINLASGDTYFLVVSSGANPANNTLDGWNLANTATGLFAQSTNGVWYSYPDNRFGAFALLSGSTASPEPGTLILLGTGLLGLGGIVRRRLAGRS